MIKENIYSKLTPSAKEALDEFVEEYKSKLLEKAYFIAEERNTANKEISLRDIIETHQASLKTYQDKAKYLEYKRRRWVMMLTFSGAIYAVGGLLIYLFQNKKFSIESDLGLLVAIIGILISLVAFLYGQLISKKSYDFYTKKSEIIEDNYDIVKRWQIIENLAKKIMTETDKNELSSNSVGFIIRFLSHKVAKNEKEFLKIRELLQLRNKILHSNYELSKSERIEFLNFADEIIERLEYSKDNVNKLDNNLRIIKAIYGTSKNSFDATEELNKLINNNRLEFIANNEIVGDPDKGTVKQLTITYSIDNLTHTKIFKEGDKVTIE